jgi:hypothetical protein
MPVGTLGPNCEHVDVVSVAISKLRSRREMPRVALSNQPLHSDTRIMPSLYYN